MSLFKSHLHFHLPSNVFTFPSDGAVAEKIIYCIFAFFVCAVSSTDDSMSDYKSISKPTKRAFEFICSIKLNDEVDMKSG